MIRCMYGSESDRRSLCSWRNLDTEYVNVVLSILIKRLQFHWIFFFFFFFFLLLFSNLVLFLLFLFYPDSLLGCRISEATTHLANKLQSHIDPCLTMCSACFVVEFHYHSGFRAGSECSNFLIISKANHQIFINCNISKHRSLQVLHFIVVHSRALTCL